jgi:hypothetical protein
MILLSMLELTIKPNPIRAFREFCATAQGGLTRRNASELF